jgi:Transposase domain (DUF772)
VRSERQLMEQINCNLLFRWFAGLGIDERRLGSFDVLEEPGAVARRGCRRTNDATKGKVYRDADFNSLLAPVGPGRNNGRVFLGIKGQPRPGATTKCIRLKNATTPDGSHITFSSNGSWAPCSYCYS